jgi:hypothetical protein
MCKSRETARTTATPTGDRRKATRSGRIPPVRGQSAERRRLRPPPLATGGVAAPQGRAKSETYGAPPGVVPESSDLAIAFRPIGARRPGPSPAGRCGSTGTGVSGPAFGICGSSRGATANSVVVSPPDRACLALERSRWDEEARRALDRKAGPLRARALARECVGKAAGGGPIPKAVRRRLVRPRFAHPSRGRRAGPGSVALGIEVRREELGPVGIGQTGRVRARSVRPRRAAERPRPVRETRREKR